MLTVLYCVAFVTILFIAGVGVGLLICKLAGI